jgi:hypothetical protein
MIDSWSQDRYLNSGPPECEVGVPSAGPKRSIVQPEESGHKKSFGPALINESRNTVAVEAVSVPAR